MDIMGFMGALTVQGLGLLKNPDPMLAAAWELEAKALELQAKASDAWAAAMVDAEAAKLAGLANVCKNVDAAADAEWWEDLAAHTAATAVIYREYALAVRKKASDTREGLFWKWAWAYIKRPFVAKWRKGAKEQKKASDAKEQKKASDAKELALQAREYAMQANASGWQNASAAWNNASVAWKRSAEAWKIVASWKNGKRVEQAFRQRPPST